MTVVSLEEHRALREQQQADLEPPLPTEHALRWTRRILAQLEGHDHVEPDLGEGTCTSCGQPAAVRFTYGTFQLCRICRHQRLAAARKADMPLPAGPPDNDPIEDLIDRARRWIPNAATTMPLAHIERALLNQGIPRAHIHELVDQAANIVRTSANTSTHADAPVEVGTP